MLKQSDFESFKAKLLKSRGLLQTGAEHLESDVHYSGKDGGDTLPFSHMADAGSDTFEMEFSMEQLENKENILYEIDQAIKRIEDKTYGICDGCENPVPKARLEAIPFSKNCIKCQEKEEESN